MRFYTSFVTDKELRIIKKTRRVLVEKIYIFLQTLILAVSLGYVVFYVTSTEKEPNIKLVLIILFFSTLFLIYFKKHLKEKNILLIKSGDDVIYNGKYIGKISEIQSMLIDEYVSAEAITGIRTVKLIINHDSIEVASGVNEKDYLEIVNLIKDFLMIPNYKIRERVY